MPSTNPSCRIRWIRLIAVALVVFTALSAEHVHVAGQRLGERDLKALSDKSIAHLLSNPDPTKSVDIHNPSSHLSKILIPRAADTPNNTLVRQYISSVLSALHWHIEEDEFTDKTPVGTKKFTNLIATKDPHASRRVIVAAHFDSKYFDKAPMNQFLGATDSAAPCAMMLDLAEALNPLLEARQSKLEHGHVPDEDEEVAETTLQLVFLDGEEAFVEWTDDDSIYGARHLAQKWASTYIAPHAKRRLLGPSVTELEGIEHFILLDLLGAKQPLIKSYFAETAWLFDAFAAVEKKLGEGGMFTWKTDKGDVIPDSADMAPGKWKSYFKPRSGTAKTYTYMGDDHVPFLHRGVPILHIISEPFPSVWHTLKDDASALDMPAMRRWNVMLRIFISEYLHLSVEDVQKRSEWEDDDEEDQSPPPHNELG